MRITIVILTAVFILFSTPCKGQLGEDKILEYLRTSKFVIDTDAAAIVLYERTDLELVLEGANARKEESIQKIIKIIRRSALSEADVKIFFPRDNSYSLKKIEGITYNLEGDKIKQTELPKDDKYKTKLTKDSYELSFTLPDVKEGSIIEFSYKKSTPLSYVLPTWYVQGEYPKLVSIYSILYSDAITFGYSASTSLPVKEFKTITEAINTPYEYASYKNQSAFSRSFNSALWVRKNIQATKEEPYVVNKNNHEERMRIMITENRMKKNVFSETWTKYNTAMWEGTASMRRENYFLDDTVKAIVKNDTNKLNKARAIFKYVRNNYKVTDDDKVAGYDLKTTFYRREGYGAQINSLLIAMLNNAGLEAYMLMAGTTSYASVSSTYPMPHLLNHRLCALVIDNYYTYLDASNKNNIFGLLPLQYYNGYARVISKEGDGVMLATDLIEDISTRMIEIKMPSDSIQNITITYKLGLISSSHTRKVLANDKSAADNIFEKYVQGIVDNSEITSKEILYKDEPDTNLIIKVSFQIKSDVHADKFFFNASYIKLLSANPFTAATREYPIEFPYRTNSTCQMNITLPTGFVIDSVAPPVFLVLDSGAMSYKKNISYFPEMNVLCSKTVMKNTKTVFEKEFYDTIRDYYEGIIKEENKVIEFRKAKSASK